MLTYKLVHLIEYHSDTLAASLVHKVQKSDRAESYANVPVEELKGLVGEIYHNLGTWLLEKSESDIEQRYTAIGTRRAQQGVPLSELLWVIVQTKHNLAEYINDVSFSGRTAELSEKQELQQLIDQFFDFAICAAAVGYEWAAEAKVSGKKNGKVA